MANDKAQKSCENNREGEQQGLTKKNVEKVSEKGLMKEQITGRRK